MTRVIQFVHGLVIILESEYSLSIIIDEYSICRAIGNYTSSSKILTNPEVNSEKKAL
jgi:hypothetical protein